MSSRPWSDRILGRYRMVSRRAQGRWATERILRKRFVDHTGRRLDVDNPRTMTEKLFARMIFVDADRDTSVTNLVDKFFVRRTVAKVIGPDVLIPVLWYGNDPTALPFDALEVPSVLKPTHMTGAVEVLRADTDRAQVIRDAQGWLRESMYWPSREYQYHDVEPALIVEKFISDGVPDGPLDYSFWCFHGNPHLVQLRNHTRDINCFVSTEFEPLDVYTSGRRSITPVKPPNWQRMLDIASALSQPFEFVRVDLYNCAGRIYVGELTFTPAGGKLRFSSPEWDERLGALWDFVPHRPVLPTSAGSEFRPETLPSFEADVFAADAALRQGQAATAAQQAASQTHAVSPAAASSPAAAAPTPATPPQA